MHRNGQAANESGLASVPSIPSSSEMFESRSCSLMARSPGFPGSTGGRQSLARSCSCRLQRWVSLCRVREQTAHLPITTTDCRRDCSSHLLSRQSSTQTWRVATRSRRGFRSGTPPEAVRSKRGCLEASALSGSSIGLRRNIPSPGPSESADYANCYPIGVGGGPKSMTRGARPE